MGKEKIFCGSGLAVDGNYGPYVKLSFTRDDLQKLVDNLTSKGWSNAVLSVLKTPTDTRTHCITLDTYAKDREMKEAQTQYHAPPQAQAPANYQQPPVQNHQQQAPPPGFSQPAPAINTDIEDQDIPF